MRKRLTLAYIINDRERKASYQKRKKGFIKKLTEICTLCAVEACCVIYSPYETGPMVWPDLDGVHAVLERFKTVSPERMRKMMDQESYNKIRIRKTRNQLYKVQRENRRRNLELHMFQVMCGSTSLDILDIHNAGEIDFVINQFLGVLEVHIKKFEGLNVEGINQLVADCSLNCVTVAGVTVSSEVEAPAVGVTAVSEAEAAADLAATMEALSPLLPSLDISMSMDMYDSNDTTILYQGNANTMDYDYAWNELMSGNGNNVLSNYWDDEGFPLFNIGTDMWKHQLARFDAGNINGGGGDRGDDDATSSSPSDDGIDEKEERDDKGEEH